MSLNQTKTQLAEAIDLYEHLESELNDARDLESYSEEEWQAQLRNLGLETAKLIPTSRKLDDDHLISILKRKEKKLARHSNWKKRNKKSKQQQRKQQIKRNEKWIKDTEWQVTISPSKTLEATFKANKTEEEEDTEKEAKRLKSKIKELSSILSKLIQLRNLRRKKLEAKGHFFADDGNQFFDRVKQWHDENQEQQGQQQGEEGNDYELIKLQQQSKKLIIHKQDVWQHIPIDKQAYQYWCESDQSLEALLKNRRMWDQYITEEDDLIHKVPPVFVTPAPPANWIWASYLAKQHPHTLVP